jgi:hypothetical protein
MLGFMRGLRLTELSAAVLAISNYIEVGAGHHMYEVRKAGSAAGSLPSRRWRRCSSPAAATAS